MKASLISTFLLLATATRIQKAAGASSGEEQLWDAAYNNNVDLVKSLLDSGVDAKATNYYGGTALMMAAKYGRIKLVELLLPKSDAKATTSSGYSALMMAARSGHDKLVELLLPKSDAKATNNQGNTAADIAQSRGYNQIVRLIQRYSN